MRAALTVALVAVIGLCPLVARATEDANPPSGPSEPSPAAAASPGAPPASTLVAALLEGAHRHCQAQEFERALALAREVLARPEASVEQRLEAHLALGLALAATGDPSGARKAFRVVIRGRAGAAAELPAHAPAAAREAFAAVQAEEASLAQELAELERNRVLRGLELAGEPPAKGQGGLPLRFGFRLRDPRGMVDQVRLRYRREGEAAFTSLSLARDDAGGWSGAIPGEWTQSEAPYQVEYYLTADDAEGRQLVDLADATAPLKVPVDPGQVPVEVPLYRNGWFWGGVGLVAVAVGAAAFLLVNQAGTLPASDLGTIRPR